MSYHKIFLKVLFFEILYSIRFGEFLPKIKLQNNKKRTDTVPCVFYFLHKISSFIRKNKIYSLVDIGSGYGRSVNFISMMNGIQTHGIEYDKEVHDSALKSRKKNVKLYCGDIFNFQIQKFKSNCFMLNDPFKKTSDIRKILHKIKKMNSKKKYIIYINNKNKTLNKLKLIYSIEASKKRSLRIFEI
jgi:hypothetical protein